MVKCAVPCGRPVNVTLATRLHSRRHGQQDTDGNPNEVTEKGGSFLSVEHKKACATSCHLEAPAKTAMEHELHEAPDAGRVGGDFGEARDATDGSTSNERNVSARCAHRCTELLRALRRSPGSKQSCSAVILETTRRRIFDKNTEEQTNTAAEPENPWRVTWSENGSKSRAPWNALQAKEATNDIKDAPDDFEAVTAWWPNG